MLRRLLDFILIRKRCQTYYPPYDMAAWEEEPVIEVWYTWLGIKFGYHYL